MDDDLAFGDDDDGNIDFTLFDQTVRSLHSRASFTTCPNTPNTPTPPTMTKKDRPNMMKERSKSESAVRVGARTRTAQGRGGGQKKAAHASSALSSPEPPPPSYDDLLRMMKPAAAAAAAAPVQEKEEDNGDLSLVEHLDKLTEDLDAATADINNMFRKDDAAAADIDGIDENGDEVAPCLAPTEQTERKSSFYLSLLEAEGQEGSVAEEGVGGRHNDGTLSHTEPSLPASNSDRLGESNNRQQPRSSFSGGGGAAATAQKQPPPPPPPPYGGICDLTPTSTKRQSSFARSLYESSNIEPSSYLPPPSTSSDSNNVQEKVAALTASDVAPPPTLTGRCPQFGTDTAVSAVQETIACPPPTEGTKRQSSFYLSLLATAEEGEGAATSTPSEPMPANQGSPQPTNRSTQGLKNTSPNRGSLTSERHTLTGHAPPGGETLAPTAASPQAPSPQVPKTETRRMSSFYQSLLASQGAYDPSASGSSWEMDLPHTGGFPIPPTPPFTTTTVQPIPDQEVLSSKGGAGRRRASAPPEILTSFLQKHNFAIEDYPTTELNTPGELGQNMRDRTHGKEQCRFQHAQTTPGMIVDGYPVGGGRQQRLTSRIEEDERQRTASGRRSSGTTHPARGLVPLRNEGSPPLWCSPDTQRQQWKQQQQWDVEERRGSSPQVRRHHSDGYNKNNFNKQQQQEWEFEDRSRRHSPQVYRHQSDSDHMNNYEKQQQRQQQWQQQEWDFDERQRRTNGRHSYCHNYSKRYQHEAHKGEGGFKSPPNKWQQHEQDTEERTRNLQYIRRHHSDGDPHNNIRYGSHHQRHDHVDEGRKKWADVPVPSSPPSTNGMQGWGSFSAPPPIPPPPGNVSIPDELLVNGHQETWEAIEKGDAHVVKCMGCRGLMQVGRSASLVFCPTCRTVSPAQGSYEPASDSDDQDSDDNEERLRFDSCITGALQRQEYLASLRRMGADITSTVQSCPGVEQSTNRKLERKLHKYAERRDSNRGSGTLGSGTVGT